MSEESGHSEQSEEDGDYEDSFIDDDDIESDKNEPRKSRPRIEQLEEDDLEVIRKKGRLVKARDTRFEPEEEPPEVDYESEDNEVEGRSSSSEAEKLPGEVLKGFLDPGELKENYCNEDDTKIVGVDLPERMQLRGSGWFAVENLEAEAKWIAQRLRAEQGQQFEPEWIREILSLYREKHFEVPYIFTYKLFDPALKDVRQDSLWDIVELDEEWRRFKADKEQLEKQLEFVFPTQEHRSKTEEINDQYKLQLYKEYCVLYIHKRMDLNLRDQQKPQARLIEAVTTSGLDKVLSRYILGAESLYDNLSKKKQMNRPQTPADRPKDVFLKFRDEKQPALCSQMAVFRSFVEYAELSLFANPSLKVYLLEKYKAKLQLSTVPTRRGEGVLVDNYLYPVKRIQKRPVSEVRRELWTLIEHAEKQGLVEVQFWFGWEDERDRRFREEAGRHLNRDANIEEIDKKDEIYLKLRDFFIDPSHGPETEAWNSVRKQILLCLLYGHVFPLLIKDVRRELKEASQKFILKNCARRFGELIRKGPINKERQPALIMAVVIGQMNEIACAVVDKDGRVLDKALVRGSDLLTNFKSHPVFTKLTRHNLDFIVVEANSVKSRVFLGEMRKHFANSSEGTVPFSCYGESGIPGLIAKHQAREGATEDLLLLEAVSLGRFKQSPMHQILSMWHESVENNGCLQIPLHYLRKEVSQVRLKAELERVAVETVNMVGVDLNLSLAHKHLSSVLQFVCGLGPRKAQHLLSQFRAHDYRPIKRRADLRALCGMGDCVFENCHAFFKIYTEEHERLLNSEGQPSKKDLVSLLECTRIPEQEYSFAYKMASEIASQGKLKKVEHEAAVAYCIKNKKDFKYLTKVVTRQLVLGFVEKELQAPFRELRDEYKDMDKRELFYMLINETPNTFKVKQVFSVKVINKKDDKKPGILVVKVQENGLYGHISESNLPEGKELHNYEVGAVVRAMVYDIPSLKADSGSGNELNLTVNMTMRVKDITKEVHPRDLHQNFADEDHWNKFQISPADYPQISEREEEAAELATRKFTHPNYRHVGAKVAVDLLESRPDGDFIIRPSSKGKEFMNITWRFCGRVTVHLSILEDSKGVERRLRIENVREEKWYKSYQEIIQQYINPINRYVHQITAHRKFMAGSQEAIEQHLKDLRASDPSMIHYKFGCFESLPQYFVLLYIPRDNKIVKEYVKVKDNGLYFHNKAHQSINALIDYFKENFRKDDYQQELRRARPPIEEDKPKRKP